MTKDAELSCRCGQVKGRVKHASPSTTNRVVCYCDDCQAFAHHLKRADLLDAQGGTDIIQVAPASLAFHGGADRIVGLRLTPKGLYRWYASCCGTPVGNTLGPAIPFVGIVARAFVSGGTDLDLRFGKPYAAIYGDYAVGTPPAGSTGHNLGLYVRVARRLLGWRLSGQTWPHPFFDRTTRAPTRPVHVLSPAEREALRPMCGPRRVAARV